jgi:dTDP-4-amino-4,6-dideoxygalactose transaminase
MEVVMIVEFLDLKRLNEPFFDEFTKKSQEIIKKGWYILGEEVESFEKSFASYHDSSFCVGVASGLDALTLILKAYKELGVLSSHDEIILPANSYIATVLSVTNNNLTPVFVEVDESFNLDASLVEKAITKKTKAILAISLYGQSANFLELQKIAKKYNLKLIEDGAQAHGAIHHDKKTSHFVDASGFSFYPTKNLGCLGDGGAVVTDDKELYECVKVLRDYGSSSKNVHPIKGVNSLLDELQAGFLNIKLKKLDSINQKRRDLANFYLKNITNSSITLPKELPFNKSVWHLFVIRSKKRDKLQNYLLKRGIKTAIHYPTPVFKQKAFSEFSTLEFEKTLNISKEILSIPLYESLTKEEATFVVEVLNEADTL